MSEMQECIGSDDDQAERSDESEAEHHVLLTWTGSAADPDSAQQSARSRRVPLPGRQTLIRVHCRVGSLTAVMFIRGHRLHRCGFQRLSRYQATWSSAKESR
jgi:hypothetical protein